jgi:hypothetical protein
MKRKHHTENHLTVIGFGATVTDVIILVVAARRGGIGVCVSVSVGAGGARGVIQRMRF